MCTPSDLKLLFPNFIVFWELNQDFGNQIKIVFSFLKSVTLKNIFSLRNLEDFKDMLSITQSLSFLTHSFPMHPLPTPLPTPFNTLPPPYLPTVRFSDVFRIKRKVHWQRMG